MKLPILLGVFLALIVVAGRMVEDFYPKTLPRPIYTPLTIPFYTGMEDKVWCRFFDDNFYYSPDDGRTWVNWPASH